MAHGSDRRPRVVDGSSRRYAAVLRAGYVVDGSSGAHSNRHASHGHSGTSSSRHATHGSASAASSRHGAHGSAGAASSSHGHTTHGTGAASSSVRWSRGPAVVDGTSRRYADSLRSGIVVDGSSGAQSTRHASTTHRTDAGYRPHSNGGGGASSSAHASSRGPPVVDGTARRYAEVTRSRSIVDGTTEAYRRSSRHHK